MNKAKKKVKRGGDERIVGWGKHLRRKHPVKTVRFAVGSAD